MVRSIAALALTGAIAGATLSAPVPVAVAAQAAPAATTVACHRTLAYYPILRAGARGPAVRTLQCLLRDRGFRPGPIDGWYGPRTRQARLREVRAYYEAVPVGPYRIAGGDWMILLNDGTDLRGLHLGDSGHRVVVLQRVLRAAYVRIDVDGVFGPRTRSLLRYYQGAIGLRQTGRVDAQTAWNLAMGAVAQVD